MEKRFLYKPEDEYLKRLKSQLKAIKQSKIHFRHAKISFNNFSCSSFIKPKSNVKKTQNSLDHKKKKLSRTFDVGEYLQRPIVYRRANNDLVKMISAKYVNMRKNRVIPQIKRMVSPEIRVKTIYKKEASSSILKPFLHRTTSSMSKNRMMNLTVTEIYLGKNIHLKNKNRTIKL